ncbi:MAG: FkbM family methyltransferase [Thermoanaerobaculia bacterium]
MKARFLYRGWKARFRGERGEIRALLERLAPGDAAVDVGANKGAYLYWMRRAVGPGGSVIAFEPQAGLARYLENVRTCLGWENVSVREVALSDSAGRKSLHVPGWENSPGASLEIAVGGNAREVDVDTLDHQLEGAGLPRIALVKVDVEGHELAVFRGAEQTLSSSRPALLFECEARHLSGRSPHEVFAFLTGLGYRGAFFSPRGLRPIGEFDPAIHQRRGPGRFWEAAGYSNNFLFEATG